MCVDAGVVFTKVQQLSANIVGLDLSIMVTQHLDGSNRYIIQ